MPWIAVGLVLFHLAFVPVMLFRYRIAETRQLFLGSLFNSANISGKWTWVWLVFFVGELTLLILGSVSTPRGAHWDDFNATQKNAIRTYFYLLIGRVVTVLLFVVTPYEEGGDIVQKHCIGGPLLVSRTYGFEVSRDRTRIHLEGKKFFMAASSSTSTPIGNGMVRVTNTTSASVSTLRGTTTTLTAFPILPWAIPFFIINLIMMIVAIISFKDGPWGPTTYGEYAPPSVPSPSRYGF